MIKEKTVKLGVCPIGKFVFSHEDAKIQKQLIYNKLNELKVDYVDIESVLEDGLVREHNHVEPIVKYFKEQKIDALFVPHCNFGTESAVGMIARQLGLPTLLWGPRDAAPMEDGTRLRDSLCGMFASSKVLYKLGVDYSYIENCTVEDNQFKEGLDKFLRAVSTAKYLKQSKIGQIGTRIDFFWCTICNESELLEKFGVQVLPFDMVDYISDIRKLADRNRSLYRAEIKDDSFIFDISGIDEEGVIKSLAMRDVLFEYAEKYNIDAWSIQSFMSIQESIGDGIGIGEAYVQERMPIAAESDIHGAISSIILEAAAKGNGPSFFPEFTVRHPENDNSVLLWHAAAAASLRDPKIKKIPLAPPWILASLPATSLQFNFKPGDVTVCRFDGDRGEYRLGTGEGKMIDGPKTRESYGWMEVPDWPSWERKLMEGPYPHHCSCIYGHEADVLEEATKFIPNLTVQRFDK
ncbi:MAG: fucose isomerase [Clostridia bacterium]|nr:fucose isomerase [Clostridia bacterium]MBN2882366.1 fucose isomerase [Clostridia bacterium]